MEDPERPDQDRQHSCDRCGRPADHCYREGSGTGHSEHVCACADHAQPLEETPGLQRFFG